MKGEKEQKNHGRGYNYRSSEKFRNSQEAIKILQKNETFQ